MFTPKISLLIAAYNEEEVIESKIRNSLELDYPKNKLEIIVASDASTDRTNGIVRQYQKTENADVYPRIILNAQVERKGKSVALNDTVIRYICPSIHYCQRW